MKKPDSLRAFLTAAIPYLAAQPERLSMYVGKGSLRATGAAKADKLNLSFEYRYTLTLTLLDWEDGPDRVMIPLLAWVGANQLELLQSYEQNRQGITFEADILDAHTVDLVIELALTERVLVAANPDGGYDVEHVGEPALDPGFGPWPDEEPDPAALALLKFKGDQMLPPQTFSP